MAKMYLQEKLPNGQNDRDILSWVNGEWTAIPVWQFFNTPVEYIDSNNSGAYINSGVATADGFEIEFYANSIGNNKGVFGRRTSSGTSIRFGIYYWDGMYVWQNNNVNTEIPNFQTGLKYKIQAGAKFDNKIIVDDVEIAQDVAMNNPGNLSIPIFGYSEGASSSYVSGTFDGRIYSLKFWSGSILVGDYIPVFNNQSGSFGLLNKLSKEFLKNAGSGSFTGPT